MKDKLEDIDPKEIKRILTQAVYDDFEKDIKNKVIIDFQGKLLIKQDNKE